MVYQKWPDKIFPIVNFFFPTLVTLIWSGGKGSREGGGGSSHGGRPFQCKARAGESFFLGGGGGMWGDTAGP